ncbi:MAG: c-type cytochrome [Myxococcales bacterium]|nr:c-type cytochrome [Myxococcales bacterium]
MRFASICIAFSFSWLLGCPSSEEKVGTGSGGSDEPSAASSVDPLTRGKKLYRRACENCHGPKGTGEVVRETMPEVGDLSDPSVYDQMSDEEYLELLQKGRDLMPAFEVAFSDDQLQAIIAYSKTLAVDRPESGSDAGEAR